MLPRVAHLDDCRSGITTICSIPWNWSTAFSSRMRDPLQEWTNKTEVKKKREGLNK